MLHPSAPERRCRVRVPLVLASALLCLLAAYGVYILQQVRMAPSTVLAMGALALPGQTGNELRSSADAMMVVASGPAWSDLETGQKHALQPLAARWALLSEIQKRRWLALAQTFATLPVAEQTKLHNRMTEWANLSAQQRNQARLNFATANKLAPDNKRAQWEAYQALSAEEKRRLAANAAPRPKGAATALRPVPARKLVQVPAATASNANPVNPPKIPPQAATAQTMPRPHPTVAPQEHKSSTPVAAPPVVVETAPVSVPNSPVIQALPPLAESAAPGTPAPETAVPTLPPSAYGH
ncbi:MULTISPECIES: DUF3106 domain-containing protein [Giesbergeria]|uniref:DUF3106 domain-containing protein n=1 Tax=Giesbergeria sinuosa TaxID=80883 RepID=A0ABV9Q9T4_9BURK